MFRNMQDTSILLIQLVLDRCGHTFICLIISFKINFEVGKIEVGENWSKNWAQRISSSPLEVCPSTITI